ncbi:MAG: SPOR domain-containing protein [Candidatus Accumulibacter sp.]|nr:SPOR domain-containing protein [Accumulibacter sp.]
MIASMRIAVFLLVLANLLLFVWARGYLGTPASSDARRTEHQLLADQVLIVSRGEPPPAINGKPAADRGANGGTSGVCQSWRDLASAEADQVERLLTEQYPAFKAARRTLSENSGYWVYIPPLANREEVSAKTAELQQLGITDFFVVQASGPNQLAISLGTYRSEEAAGRGLQALRAKGVKSAVMGERKGKPTSVALDIHGPEAQAEALRQAIIVLLPKASPTACKPGSESVP